MMELMVRGFGFPSEWKDFHERHRLFFERLPDLTSALEIAFIRELTPSSVADTVVFYLGRLCVEDFHEIVLLCGNGYGYGAMRLIRGMYERAVTAHHLHLHPDEAQDFLDFHWITKHKQANAVREVMGMDLLPPDQLKELEARYSQVKNRFLVPDCKKCGTTRMNHTWTQLDFVSMAKQADFLGKFVVPAYYLPTEQAHSTPGTIVARIGGTENKITFTEGPQRKEADQCLLTAYFILLGVLYLQRDHFTLDTLKEPLAKCLQNIQVVWGDEAKQWDA